LGTVVISQGDIADTCRTTSWTSARDRNGRWSRLPVSPLARI
jgi:hypothetical protein